MLSLAVNNWLGIAFMIYMERDIYVESIKCYIEATWFYEL